MGLPTEQDLLDPLVRWYFLSWLEGENGAMWAVHATASMGEVVAHLEGVARRLPDAHRLLSEQNA